MCTNMLQKSIEITGNHKIKLSLKIAFFYDLVMCACVHACMYYGIIW